MSRHPTGRQVTRSAGSWIEKTLHIREPKPVNLASKQTEMSSLCCCTCEVVAELQQCLRLFYRMHDHRLGAAADRNLDRRPGFLGQSCGLPDLVGQRDFTGQL